MQSLREEYIIHPTEHLDRFIHEYPNGRRVLVEIDPETNKEIFIKEL